MWLRVKLRASKLSRDGRQTEGHLRTKGIVRNQTIILVQNSSSDNQGRTGHPLAPELRRSTGLFNHTQLTSEPIALATLRIIKLPTARDQNKFQASIRNSYRRRHFKTLESPVEL